MLVHDGDQSVAAIDSSKSHDAQTTAKRPPSTVLSLSLIYFPLLAASVCLMATQVYFRMTTQRQWRRWLTHHLLDRWLRNGRHYQLKLVTGDHKNPENRIADDVRLATEAPVDFATGVTTAALSAATFIVVLWTIGGSLSFSLAGIGSGWRSRASSCTGPTSSCSTRPRRPSTPTARTN
jgi:ABC-type uncharacterized transport system fused permease/ATPase subunit